MEFLAMTGHFEDPMEKNSLKNEIIPDGEGTRPADAFESEIPVGMTLESIIDLTGEMEHLNELVMLHLDKDGGFTCKAGYFSTVQPILDLLEVEIRVRYQPGMSKKEMKVIIGNWIDEEICSLQ
jgi:hypothetical protein